MLRDLLGAQPGAGAALPDELPARCARADVPRLPRLGRPRRGGQVREPGRHGLAAVTRLGGRAGLHARDVRRVRAPRRPAQRPRHRLRRRHDPARAGGDAADGRMDPARGGGRLPGVCLLRRRAAGELGHRACRLRRAADRRPDLHGPAGDLRRPARRRRHLHRAVHALRGGARVLGRRALLPRHLARGHRAAAHRPGPHDRDGGLPARHRVGLRRRHHGHARQRHLAAPAPRRLPQGRGRRRARRVRHRRDPVAADARRRRVHHRRVPRGLLPDGPALCGDPVAPLLPRDLPGDRGRRPALRDRGGQGRHAAGGQADPPLRLPLLVAVRDRVLHGDRAVAVPRRALRDGARVPALLPRSRSTG